MKVSSPPVRRADSGDLAAVADLFDQYRVFYGCGPDPQGALAFVQARLERGDSVILLAEDGGRAVGFTQLYASFSSVRMQPILILNDLFVAPQGRRQGVARTLLAAARAHARSVGVARLVLETAADNHAAQTLYVSDGWRREDIFTYSRSAH